MMHPGHLPLDGSTVLTIMSLSNDPYPFLIAADYKSWGGIKQYVVYRRAGRSEELLVGFLFFFAIGHVCAFVFFSLTLDRMSH
jgi:hypothetical protein